MLSDYIDAALRKAWAWGNSDCCFFAGDWIREETGFDPLGPYRDTYDTAIGAGRLIRERGGLARMVDAEMARCGFKVVQRAEHGDIAVLAHGTGGGDAVAGAAVVIRSGPWWLARAKEGIVGMQAQTVAIWRVQ